MSIKARREERARSVENGTFELDVQPLREWLEWQIRCGWTHQDLATFFGVDQAKITKWRNGNLKHVQLQMIDAALCRAGRPDLLHRLWPDLHDQIHRYVACEGVAA